MTECDSTILTFVTSFNVLAICLTLHTFTRNLLVALRFLLQLFDYSLNPLLMSLPA